MCTVSMIGDGWGKQFHDRYPWYPYDTNYPQLPQTPNPYIPTTPVVITTGPTKEEFEALKREVQELKKLLLQAKEFDAKTGQPHCEKDEKVEMIKKIAKYVGVDVNDVFND